MARRTSQNARFPHSQNSHDISSANLTLSYTGSVAAQSAGDSSPDLDEYFTTPSDMQSDRTPRTLPPGHLSRSRIPPHLAAAFSGDSSFASSRHYVLKRDSQSGPQNFSAGNRQSIDLSGDPSRSALHLRSDLPWSPLEATDTPPNAASRRSRPANFIDPPRTPDINIDPFTDFPNSCFHDSALGTVTGPSQDERQSLMSSPLDDMGPYGWYGGPPPQEVQRQDEQDELDEQHEPDETGSQVERGEDQPRPKQKNQKQSRSKEELTCKVCRFVSKTPSDSKKHQARHDTPFKCKIQDCQRATKGFATINDLHRHEKSVHGKNARNSKYYKCFAVNCAKADKEWPRLDNFKQHLVRMHPKQEADELVQRSNDWYEEQYGSGPTQSAAVTGVLRSQEKAARGPSQPKRKRRDSSSSLSMPPQKRVAPAQLRTQGMPLQDPKLLSPLSAQFMTRSTSSVSQQPTQPVPFSAMQNMRSPVFQTQTSQPQGQPRSTNRMPGPIVPYQRRLTEGQARPTMPPQNQHDLTFQWSSTNAYSIGFNPYVTHSAYDQQSQAPQGRHQGAPPPRPHTAPDGNPDFTHVQMTLLDQSNPIPPAQDDFEMNMNQYLAFSGEGTNMPQSSPDTSNGPRTPNQSVPLPSIAVENESDEDEGKVKALTDFLAEELTTWIHQHGTKSEEGRRLLITRDVPSILASIVRTKSSHGSASVTGTSQKSVTGTASSRASKTLHICPKCQKLCKRQSDLKKHMKRHSRPYGCVLDDCYKRFGSKNDLQRHENKVHTEQKECYRCDGSHNEDGQACFKVFYNGRDNYKKHLEKCFSHEVQQIEKKANACRIPANNQGRFWCGFCNKIIPHDKDGPEASKFRLSHIDAHFSQGKWAVDWIELGGNGLTKAQVEIQQNRARIEEIHARELVLGQQVENDDSQGSSSSSTSPENHDDSSRTRAVPASHSLAQQRNHAPALQRQHSGASQYQHVSHQSSYQQQMAQQMQRARSQSHTAVYTLRDPPQRKYNEHGQRLATQANCCKCELDWPLDLGRQCTICDHDMCSACKLR